MTNALPPVSPGRFLGTRTYALLTLGYLIFVIYGSLVPLHCVPLSWEETCTRWQHVLNRPLGYDSRMDFITNVLLFIPLSFLMVGTAAVGRGRVAAVAAAVVVIPFCSALSASIEFTQLWFPPRFSSLNDVLGETIGAVLGSLTWIVAGRRVTEYVESAWAAAGPNNLAMKLLPGYLFVLVFIHVMPLDLTISPGELYHKWKLGRVVLIPFTTDYGSLSRAFDKTAWNMAYFAPLGWLLALWPRPLFASGWRVLAAGALAAGTVEFLQLFVVSRYCDVTDIVTGTAAVWLTWCLSEVWRARQPGSLGEALRANQGLLRVGLLAVWFAAAAAFHWSPDDVVDAAEFNLPPRNENEAAEREGKWVLSDDGRVLSKGDGTQTLAVQTIGPFLFLTNGRVVEKHWQETSLLPLVDVFYGTTYQAFDEMLQKMLLFVPLGALLVMGTGGGWRAVWRVGVAGLCLASLFAAGQLCVPNRLCSVSAVLVETCGAMLGFVFVRRVLVLMDARPAASVDAPLRTGVLLPASREAVFLTTEELLSVPMRPEFLPDDRMY